MEVSHILLKFYSATRNSLSNSSVPHFYMRLFRQAKDHHHSADKIFELFEKMQTTIFPNGINEDEFKKFLYAVQHVERYPAKEVKSGRRPRFERGKLLAAASLIKSILESATNGRISLLYFISNCLPALDYPPDVKKALNENKINLDEARSLARINKINLGDKANRKPVEIRRELLLSHLRRHGSQKELRERVSERLGTTAKAAASAVSYHIAAMDFKVNELLEMNESDTDHLLWEEIKSLVFLAREIDVTLIGEDSLKEILNELGSVSHKLLKYKTQLAVKWWEEKR